MANNKKVNIGIGFNVDRSGLNNLKTELNSLQNMTIDDLVKIGSEDAVHDLQEIKKAAGAVQEALEKSFNPKLNTQDLTKFQQQLQLSGLNISSIKAGLDKAGASGQAAFRNITAELLTTNRQMKQTSQWLNKMADTMANTVRWTVASAALNTITGSIQKAYSFTKQLDTSLNDIRIVTGKSADEMQRFAKEATTAAKNLGSTTTAYTKAALIYEQQGLGATDVSARSDVTTKVANVTGSNADTVSQQLTAIWNGYKVSAEEAELYIDKVSAVAATTAADLAELSEGMGKVASAANAMGVDIDQLNASLATIISVTRQDASAVGTSLKTIYARMGDLMVDGEDEFGTKLGDVSSKLKTMGIQVLDAQDQMRDMGIVIEEVAAKWDTWTSAQQQAAAVALAGKRQYNNLIALFENWDMYEEAKSTSKGGVGELQKQQDIYMESMEAHLNKLQVEAEDLYQTLLDPKGLNPMIDALTTLVGLVNNMIQGLGGGSGLLNTLGAIGLNVFSKQITQGIVTATNNIIGFKENLKQVIAEEQIIKELGAEGLGNERQQELVDIAKKRLEIAESISEAEHQIINDFIKQTNELFKQEDALKKTKNHIIETAKAHLDIEAKFDDDGNITNIDELKEKFQEQLDKGFPDSQDAGLNALAAIEEAEALAATVQSRQNAVTYRKREVKKNQDAQMNLATQATSDATYSPDQSTVLINEDLERQNQLSKEAKECADALANANQKLEESKAALKVKTEEQKETIKALLEQIEREINNEELSADQKRELLEVQKDLTKAYKSDGSVKTKNNQLLNNAVSAVKKYNTVIKNQRGQVTKAMKDLDTYNKRLQENKKNLEENADAQQKLKKNFDLTKTIQNVTDLVGGIANLATGIKTLHGLGDIWRNEDLSTGEKLLQIITAGSTVFLQLIGPIKNAVTWTKQLMQTQREAAAIQEVLTALSIKDTSEKTINALTSLSNAAALKVLDTAKADLTNEEYKAIAAELAHGGSLSAESAALIANAAAQGVAKTATDATTASIYAQTAAMLSNPITAIAVVIIAALTALIALTIALANAESAEAKAAREAAEGAKRLAENYNKVREAYEALKQNLIDYEDVRSALDELTVGTEEWYDAVDKLNQKVLELMKNYPELAQYISSDKNGVLTIAKEGMDFIRNQQRATVESAKRQAWTGEIQNNSVQLTNAFTDFIRDVGYYTTTFKDAKASGALTAYSLDENAYEEEQKFSLDITRDQLEKTLEAINADTSLLGDESHFKTTLTDALKDSNLVDALWANKDALTELATTYKTTNANLDIYSKQYVNSILKDSGKYLTSDYQAQVQNLLNKKLIDETDKLYAEKYRDGQGITDREAQEKYVAYMNSTGQWKNGKVVKNKSGNKANYSYEDANGNIIAVDDMADSTVRYVLAQNEAATAIKNEDFEKVNAYLESIIKGTEEALKTAMPGQDGDLDYQKQLEEQVDKINQQLANAASGAHVDLTNFSKKEIEIFKDQLEKGLSENIAILNEYAELSYDQILGETGFATEAINGIAAQLANAGNILNDDLKQAFNSIFEGDNADVWDQISVIGKQRMAKVLDAIATLPDDAVKNFTQIFNKLTTSYKDVDELVNKLSGITTLEGLEEYADKLFQDQELLSAIGKEGIQDIIDAYTIGFNLWEARSVDAIQKSTEVFLKIAQAVKQQGDTISAEDYESLGKEAQRYFTLMGDGTYMLNSAAGEFLASAKAARMEQFKKDQEALISDSGKATENNEKFDLAEKEAEKKRLEDEISNLTNVGDVSGLIANLDVSQRTANYSTSANYMKINASSRTDDATIIGLTTDEKAGVQIASAKLIEYSDLIKEYNEELWNKLFNGKGVKGSSAVYDASDNNSIYYGNIMALYQGLEFLQTQSGKVGKKQADLDKVNQEIEGYNTNISIINETDNKRLENLDAIIRQAGSYEEALGYAQYYADSKELDSTWAANYLADDKFKGLWTNRPDPNRLTVEDISKNYEKTGREIDRLTGKLEILQQQQEDLYGDELTENLAQQLVLQRDIVAKKQEELRAAQQLKDISNVERDNQLSIFNAMVAESKQLKSEDIDFETDADGYITNRDAIEAAFNESMIGLSAASLAQAEAARDAILQMIDDHNDGLYDLVSGVFDAQQGATDIALQKLDAAFREQHEYNEYIKNFNNFIKEFTTDEDDYGAQGTLTASDFNAALSDAQQSMSKIYQLTNLTKDEASGGYVLAAATATQAAVILTEEELRTEIMKEGNTLQEYALELKGKLFEIQELELSQIEEITEQYEIITSNIESMNELLEHQATIQALIYGENSIQVRNLNQQQINNTKTMLETQTAAYDNWLNKIKEIQDRQEEGITISKHDQKLLDEYTQRAIEAGKTVAATSAEYASMLSNQYQANIEATFDTLFSGLDKAKEQYDWITSQAEKSFDALSGAMEIQKLANSWTKAMYDNKSLIAQDKMNTFIEERVAWLKEESKITQYTLDREQARFELLQAQIALEEAQANKTSMRLVRGADGTYNYQYVADTNEIMEKQQAVLDANQTIMDLDKEEVKNHFDEIYDIATEFMDKYKEAWSDTKIEDSERDMLERMWNALVEEVGNTDELMNKLRESMQKAAEAAGLEDYTQLTDAEMKALFPEMNSEYYNLLMQYASGEKQLTQSAFIDMMNGANSAATTFLTALGVLNEDLTDIMQGTTEKSGISILLDGISEEARKKIEEGDLALQNLNTTGQNLETTFKGVETNILNTVKALEELLDVSDLASSTTPTDDSSHDYVLGSKVESNSSSIGSGGSFNSAWLLLAGGKSRIELAQYDTGGYTGEWGSEGKHAILHEKELVLNKVDTQDILSSVSIVRDISGYIDMLSTALDNNLVRMTNNLTEPAQPVQNIEIHAEFPNATDKISIKEAFEEILAEAEQMLYENIR